MRRLEPMDIRRTTSKKTMQRHGFTSDQVVRIIDQADLSLIYRPRWPTQPRRKMNKGPFQGS